MADHGPSPAPEALGPALLELIEKLYPICRSITGEGVRETLRILSSYSDLEIHEVPSGTEVLDWTVPREWNIRDAWIKNQQGERVVDFRKHNLHVVSYSTPIRASMSLDQLRPHLHTLPEQPELIPYRTSYYQENWGFCLPQRDLDALAPGDYEVCIDSSLEPGSLTYGEVVLPGASKDEILISTHVCHPSLCDDNLSGIAISIFLARELARRKRRLSVRFLYAPGTIGAITWLAQNRETASRVRHGMTLTCLGDQNQFTYKRTVNGDASVDRAAELVLRASGRPHQIIDFFPYGYDERQYNSPGFRLAVGSLMRGRHGQFPEYHTSADNLAFIGTEQLIDSYRTVKEIVLALDGDQVYKNLAPYGEPQLGRRGLYRALGGTNVPNLQFAMLWVLNLSDGRSGLIDIARRAELPFESIRTAADLLIESGLLEEIPATA
jgi:aminopeptidase-like protein